VNEELAPLKRAMEILSEYEFRADPANGATGPGGGAAHLPLINIDDWLSKG